MSQHRLAEPLLRRAPTVLSAALRSAAAEHGVARLAFQEAGGIREASLGEIHEYARRVAAGLVALGVQPGEVVAVQLPTRIETAIAHAAVVLCGGVLLPLCPEFTPEKTRLILRLAGAAALITSVWRSHDVLRMRGLANGLPQLRQVIAVSGTWPAAAVPADAVDWSVLSSYRPLEPVLNTRLDDMCLLAWTEGGGGTPACIQHTHRSVWAELTPREPGGKRRRKDVYLNTMPFGCPTAPAGLLRAMVWGTPTVFMERWQAQAALDLVHRYRATSAEGTAFHLAGLLDTAERTGLGNGPLTDYLVGDTDLPSALAEQAARVGVSAYLLSHVAHEESAETTGTVADRDE
ncbi:AMP-binding protein [Streptomyces acidicola]|uniref:AMP-binding protein n=1 Tax=Streptomyces acidicola TaxID=2596892 RepID=UPI00381DEAAD